MKKKAYKVDENLGIARAYLKTSQKVGGKDIHPEICSLFCSIDQEYFKKSDLKGLKNKTNKTKYGGKIK